MHMCMFVFTMFDSIFAKFALKFEHTLFICESVFEPKSFPISSSQQRSFVLVMSKWEELVIVVVDLSWKGMQLDL